MSHRIVLLGNTARVRSAARPNLSVIFASPNAHELSLEKDKLALEKSKQQNTLIMFSCGCGCFLFACSLFQSLPGKEPIKRAKSCSRQSKTWQQRFSRLRTFFPYLSAAACWPRWEGQCGRLCSSPTATRTESTLKAARIHACVDATSLSLLSKHHQQRQRQTPHYDSKSPLPE